MPCANSRSDILKKRCFDATRQIPSFPQVTLQGLEICNLDIARDKVTDVCLDSSRAGAIFFWKGGNIWREFRVIPLRFQDTGERIQTVGKLDVYVEEVVRGQQDVGAGSDERGLSSTLLQ